MSQSNPTKYIVCNGDEGEPGAFMDRSIMEGDPHKVIEGMLISGHATGAEEGYIYVRAEYPMAVNRLKIAIKQASQYGLLGENILDSGFNFNINIVQGAGAFVCGEGSALNASREGTKRMLQILEDITEGRASEEDLNLLYEIADTVKNTSLCGLGKTAANPVLSTLEYFYDEYLTHVTDKVCSTKICKGLSKIEIDQGICKSCGKCAKVCPVEAISGKVKQAYLIDSDICIKCGACIEVCPFKAIMEV